MEQLWHVLRNSELQKAIEGGELLPTTIGLPSGATPIIWLTNQTTLPGNNSSVLIRPTNEVPIALFRLRFPMGQFICRVRLDDRVVAHDWKAFKASSRMSAQHLSMMYEHLTSHGSKTSSWYVTFDKIPCDHWLEREAWDGSNWIPYDNAIAELGRDHICQVIDELVSGVRLCADNKKLGPAQMLIYAAIDVFGAADTTDSTDGQQSKSYMAWVDRYLLPNSGLPCNSIDIWGARCGLLHTNSSESRLSSQGKARQIVYAMGYQGVLELEERIRELTSISAVVVEFEHFVSNFFRAAQAFRDSFTGDERKCARLYPKMTRMFAYFGRTDPGTKLTLGI